MAAASFSTSPPVLLLREKEERACKHTNPLDAAAAGSHHHGSWSWQLSSSTTTSSTKQEKHSKRTRRSKREAGQPSPDAHQQQNSNPFVPTLFLGDLFVPCNTMGLFRKHEDLDALFSGASLPQSDDAPAKRKRHKRPARKPLEPSSHQEPQDTEQQGQNQQSSVGIDPAAQLTLRMATPVEGRRLFFVSHDSADVIRQAMVLERYDQILAKQAEQAASQSQIPPFPRPSDIREWVSGISEWLQPSSKQQQPPVIHHPQQSLEATSRDSKNSTSSSRRSRTDGERKESSSPPLPKAAPSFTSPFHSSFLNGPLTSGGGGSSLLGWFANPMAALSQSLEQDLSRLEEEAVIAEAEHITSGEGGKSPLGGGLVSYVGRIPLEAAYRAMCRQPQRFDMVITGSDARLASAAHGKQALLDLHAGTDEKWMLKIKDDDVNREASEADDEHDMALSPRTPIFTVPGMHVALRLQGGHAVHLRPTFLSITQLHAFAQVAKTLAGRMWLSSRASKREQMCSRVESVAVALAGNGSTTSGVSSSSKGSPDEDEDEEGFGEPPEAKQLLAELGEGRGGSVGPPLLPPATGAVGFLNAVAVGTVSVICKAATSLGDGLDRALLASPLGLAASGVPRHVAVKVGYLEDTVVELKKENQRRRDLFSASHRLDSKEVGTPQQQLSPQQQQPLSQQSQQSESPAPPPPLPSQQPLESSAGLGLILQALWAVMHNTTSGDGQLAASLANNWRSTTKISAPRDGEVSAVLAVQIKSQVATPSPVTPPASLPSQPTPSTPSTPSSQPTDAASTQSPSNSPPDASASAAANTTASEQQQAGPSTGTSEPQQQQASTDSSTRANSSDTSSSNRRAESSPSRERFSSPLRLPKVATTTQAHKFEVGLHLNLQDAFGSDWEREESDELMGLDLRGLEAREGGQEEESSRQQQDSNAQTSDHKAEDLGQESTSGREHGTQEGQGEKQPSGKESRQLKKASRRPGSLVDTGSAYQGLLLMGDLGLQKDEDESPWRAPPLGFCNLSSLLEERRRR